MRLLLAAAGPLLLLGAPAAPPFDSLALRHDGAAAPPLPAAAAALAAFSPTYAAACALLPAAVPCVTDLRALACGGDASVAHLDLLTATALASVAVPAALAHLAPAVCLAPDTDLRALTPLGHWGGWEMRPSALAGQGAHALAALPAGACLGRAARVYSARYFNDYPTVSGVNHCAAGAANVAFVAAPDAEQRVLHLFLRATRAIAAGEELCADYAAPDSPRPNFIAAEPYEAFPY